MALKRTTFSESWYRVDQLTPQMHPCLQSYRQSYRGEMWHVLEDPISNQFFRVNHATYQFLAMLDGKKAVQDVWQLCLDRYGDDAPTQGEVIKLLGQLHNYNLLQGDIPVDTSNLLKRYKERRQREITGQLRGILFAKIPLWDPNRFLKVLDPIFGLLFTKLGLFSWIGLALVALVYALSGADDLDRSTNSILSMSNLPWLYLCFALIKIFHELGHAFACKRFGLRSGSGGAVHKMGIMLMLLTPIPFVDCTSSWALRSKWQRIIVGGAGMIVELMIAAIAVIVWTQTTEGSLINSLAYNVMFVTSVSTILFNGNPLLRYDAYYMLSDYLEIPNLSNRSNTYFLKVCKEFFFGIEDLHHPAETRREKFWLFSYSIAAYIYRLMIFVTIFLFISDFFFLIGFLFGLAGIYRIVMKPIWDFLKYLIASPELALNRTRAYIVSSIAGLILIFGLFSLNVPDRVRIEGVVEPASLSMVYVQTEGLIDRVTKTGDAVKKGDALVGLDNYALIQDFKQQELRLEELIARHKDAQTRDIVEAQILAKKIRSMQKSLVKVKKKMDRLNIHSQLDGIWLHSNIHKLKGTYIEAGELLGMVADPSKMIIRAVASQNDSQLIRQAQHEVEYRIKGRPEILYHAQVLRNFEAGRNKLPSAALGYALGGEIQVVASSEDGTDTAEKVFEIHIVPEEKSSKEVLPGQVVVLRFELAPKPLYKQAFRRLKQAFQKRFNII